MAIRVSLDIRLRFDSVGRDSELYGMRKDLRSLYAEKGREERRDASAYQTRLVINPPNLTTHLGYIGKFPSISFCHLFYLSPLLFDKDFNIKYEKI